MTLYSYRLGSTVTAGQIVTSTAKIEKKESTRANSLKLRAVKNAVLELGDEIKFYDLNNNYIFGGEVQKIIDQPGIQDLEISDYAIVLSQTKVSEVYRSATPEAIIEDIIDTYTDFTFNSTITTGISIDKIVFKDEYLIDIINKLLELFNGTFEVDKNKVFDLFVKLDTVSSKSLDFDVDVLQGGWVTDNLPRAEKVIVVGAPIDQRTTETLTGTGTEFFTTYTPDNVEISGLKQTTTTIDGDFEVDKQAKKITFDSSQSNPVVNYTYPSQVRVELGEGKTVVLEKKYIETTTEALNLAREYKTRFEDGAQNSKWLKADTDIDSYIIGNRINVTDETNNKTGSYIVKSVVFTLPSQMVVTVGETDVDLFDWQKETIDRIKQLEAKDQNEDFITKYDFVNNDLNITLKTDVITFQVKDTGNGFILDDDTRGLLDGDTVLDGLQSLIFDDPLTGFDQGFGFDVSQAWETVSESKFPLSLPFSLR